MSDLVTFHDLETRVEIEFDSVDLAREHAPRLVAEHCAATGCAQNGPIQYVEREGKGLAAVDLKLPPINLVPVILPPEEVAQLKPETVSRLRETEAGYVAMAPEIYTEDAPRWVLPEYAPPPAVAPVNPHVGSSLESFFEERGELGEVRALAQVPPEERARLSAMVARWADEAVHEGAPPDEPPSE